MWQEKVSERSRGTPTLKGVEEEAVLMKETSAEWSEKWRRIRRMLSQKPRGESVRERENYIQATWETWVWAKGFKGQ